MQPKIHHPYYCNCKPNQTNLHFLLFFVDPTKYFRSEAIIITKWDAESQRENRHPSAKRLNR